MPKFLDEPQWYNTSGKLVSALSVPLKITPKEQVTPSGTSFASKNLAQTTPGLDAERCFIVSSDGAVAWIKYFGLYDEEGDAWGEIDTESTLFSGKLCTINQID